MDAIGRDLVVETAPLALLKPHPRNYRQHPEAQIEHIMASIAEHGLYRPIVVARDNTVLAGHGLLEAARRLDRFAVPVVRLDVDPDDADALKLLVGDNEIGRLADEDERSLARLLESIVDIEDGALESLLGTGHDGTSLEQLLATLTPTAPSEFQEITPDVETDFRCPSCGYEWSGSPS